MPAVQLYRCLARSRTKVAAARVALLGSRGSRRNAASAASAALQKMDMSPPRAETARFPKARPGDLLYHLRADDESALSRCSPENEWDAIVIGGGHNGLTAAAYLAERLPASGDRSKARVALVERRAVLGGASLTEEVHEGYLFSRASYVLSLLRPAVVEELGLVKTEGLRAHLRSPSSFTPLQRGSAMHDRSAAGLLLGSADSRLDDASLRALSPRDADAFGAYEATLNRVAAAIGPLLDAPPPLLREVASMPPSMRTMLGLGPVHGGASRGTVHEEAEAAADQGRRS